MDKFLSSKKNTGIILIAEALAVFAMAVLTIHDTNTATGTGYWFLLKFNVLGRTFWDLAVDALLVLTVIALTLIPLIILKGKLTDAFLFFLANVALNTYIRPDRLLSLFTGSSVERSDALYALLSFLPGLFLIVAFTIALSAPKMYLYFGEAACLIVLGICLPGLSEVTRFAAGYTALIPYLGYLVSERDDKNVLYIRILPGTLFCLCGIWRLIMVLSTYHI